MLVVSDLVKLRVVALQLSCVGDVVLFRNLFALSKNILRFRFVFVTRSHTQPCEVQSHLVQLIANEVAYPPHSGVQLGL